MEQVVFSQASQEAWAKHLSAAAKPTRWPHFPGLDHSGKWTAWSPEVSELEDDATTCVEQPLWIHALDRGKDMQPLRGLQHRSLPAGHIRLVRMERACMNTTNNLLGHFQLVEVPLCSAPAYEALSCVTTPSKLLKEANLLLYR
jgi:hypothetical protein